MITGIDDHSRFCVIAKLAPRATARPVCEALLEGLSRHGAPGQRLARATIQTELNGNPLLSDLLRTFAGTRTTGVDLVVAAQDLTLRADGGTNVILLVERDSTTGSGELHAAVSGYLIDCSVAPCS